MSDNLSSPYNSLKFQQSIKIGSNSPQSLARLLGYGLNANEVAVSLTANNRFFSELMQAKQIHPQFSLVRLVNTQLGLFQIKENTRLEERFYRICSAVNCKLKKTKGRRRQEFYDETKTVAVLNSETETIHELTDKLTHFKMENVRLEKRCSDLLHCLQSAVMQKEEQSKNVQDFDKVCSENARLANYIQQFHDMPFPNLSGQSLDTMNKSEYKQTIRELETLSERALWFAETFGLLPQTLVCSTNDGTKLELNLSKEEICYTNLPEAEKRKLKEILFVMDKFCVSDSAYYELSMYCTAMPRKYLIVQCRTELNGYFHIERTPGGIPGAYVSFKAEVQTHVEKMLEKDPKLDKVLIKVSGDGSKVSRVSNFVVLSFALINDENKLSSNEQKTVAIIQAPETYESLRLACGPIFDEINELYREKSIQIGEKNVELEIVFGGDMKFIQLLLGLGGSTGNFACPWCKIHKDERYNMEKAWDFYHSHDLLRSIEELKRACDQYGIKARPLIEVDIENVIPDELHLFMRIFDILLRNVIYDAKDKDDGAKSEKLESNHLESLVSEIRKCGVSFQTWSNKGSNDLEWTSLSCAEMKKVVERLPLKMYFIIHEDTHDATVRLWQDFESLHMFLCSRKVELNETQEVFVRCRTWVEHFIELGKKRRGYQKKNVTPYMHCLVYHVPFFTSKYGSIRKFTGQGVEKINDDIKKLHQGKTSKHDSAVEALKARKRIELALMGGLERQRREYRKTNDAYWEGGKRSKTEEKKRKIAEEIEMAKQKYCERVYSESEKENNISFETLSCADIKSLLVKAGIKTKLRRREKLVELLRSVYP